MTYWCLVAQVCDLGAETRALFPLREDEWRGPQFVNDAQRERAVGMLINALTDFLSPDHLPPPDFKVGFRHAQSAMHTQALCPHLHRC